jgi:hypothetical protein
MYEAREAEQVRAALETFFQGLGRRDQATIRRLWHPDARLFLNNAVLHAKPLSFLLSLPDCLDFQVRAIDHIDMHRVVASARVDYAMTIGTHSGFFNLVKADGEWQIANWVDHGQVGQN